LRDEDNFEGVVLEELLKVWNPLLNLEPNAANIFPPLIIKSETALEDIVQFSPTQDVTASHMCDLECAWNRGLIFTKMRKVQRDRRKAEECIPTHFGNMSSYKKNFNSLLKEEMETDRRLTLNTCYERIYIDEWQESSDGYQIAVISTFSDDQNIPLSPGSHIYLTRSSRNGGESAIYGWDDLDEGDEKKSSDTSLVGYKHEGWKGVVKHTTYKVAYVLMQHDTKGIQGSNPHQRYDLKFDWNGEIYSRMNNSLEISDVLPKQIQKVLLGKSKGNSSLSGLGSSINRISQCYPIFN